MSTPPGAATGARPPKRENIFTHKIGPLPMWAWLLIATALILGWAWYNNKKNPKTAPTDTANASQVPQFVNQTYTTVGAPLAPKFPDHDKDVDKDKKKKQGDNDDEQDEDQRHKKHPRHRRHPTHHHDSAQVA